MRAVRVEVRGPEKQVMRTALLETATAKSMRVNDKNNFAAAKVCSLQNES